jgi:hypothetical protein
VRTPTIVLLGIVVLAACGERATNTAPLTGGQLQLSATKGPTDPTATWKYPLNDAGLGVRSDHLYSDGTYSVYANGVCNVATTIFATTQLSNSGDATLNTGASGKCVRHFTFVYPDGFTESTPIFNNLRDLENTTDSIPVGSTLERQLHMGSDVWPNVSSRCGGLIWGYGAANNIAFGSDSVLVTRVDASTWHVVTKLAPDNMAYCKNTGELLSMPVDFTVISSRPLP